MAEQQAASGVPRVAEESEAVQSGAVDSSATEDVQAAKDVQQGITHPELEAGIAKIQNTLDARVKMIRDDRRLDKGEIRQQIREQWHKAEDVYQQVMAAYERQLEEDSAEKERGVFYVGGRELQDSVRSAYNDLYDRTELPLSSGETEGITYAREELERLWERALRTSDRALMTAVGHRATELGMAELRDAWLATSKEKTNAWGRYVAARQQLDHFKDPGGRFWGHMTRGWSLRKPEEA